MISKIVVVLSVALCVQGEEDAISEQRVVIHHQKSYQSSHIGPNKSGNQDAYAKSYPSYEFSYNVNDPKTHDIKGQHETREGDEVIGNYWLIEPNGRKRTVNYQANDDNGFNAQIYYAGALKEEETDKDVSVSQEKGKDQSNLEKNNEEVVEVNVAEEIQDTKSINEVSAENDGLSTIEERTSSEESDNQEGEANNISNVERVNVDRNHDENLHQFSEKVDNNENNNRENNDNYLNKSARGTIANNIARKVKNEKIKKNRDQGWVSSRNSYEGNQDNNNEPKHSKRIKQDDPKLIVNNNRNSNKGKKSRRNKNLNIPQNGNIENSNISENKGQITENQQENVRQQDRNYAFVNFAPGDEIQRKIDIPNNQETFEHRIRIYHPKHISTTPKLKKH